MSSPYQMRLGGNYPQYDIALSKCDSEEYAIKKRRKKILNAQWVAVLTDIASNYTLEELQKLSIYVREDSFDSYTEYQLLLRAYPKFKDKPFNNQGFIRDHRVPSALSIWLLCPLGQLISWVAYDHDMFQSILRLRLDRGT